MKHTEHLEDLVVRFCSSVEGLADRVVFLGALPCPQLPGFVSVSFPGHSAEGLMHMLDIKGIAVSTGEAERLREKLRRIAERV